MTWDNGMLTHYPRVLAEERARWERYHSPEHAPGHVRALAQALDDARRLARPFGTRSRDRTLDRAHARALAPALDAARRLAVDVAGDAQNSRGLYHSGWSTIRAHSLADCLAADLRYALDDVDALGRPRLRALDRKLDHAFGLDRVGRLDRGLDHYLRRALDPARVVELAEAVGLDPADDSVAPADDAAEWHVVSGADEPVVTDPAVAGPAVDTAPPARSATHVLHGALRVLPVAARARYREELDGELAALAAAGHRRRDQLAYALRAAGRMASLRRALRTPGPRG